MFASSARTDFPANNYCEVVPNFIILKYEFSGRLFKKIINASFAIVILLPDIEPLQSNKKIYSP